jgi:hypothetical protein
VAWAAAAEWIEEAEERRTRQLGLVRLVGLVRGEPVYFQSSLFTPDQLPPVKAGGKGARYFALPPLAPFPEPDKEPAAVIARIDALPRVGAEEIVAAGFAPAPEEWRPDVVADL